ncbi:ATP synthase F1 subunit epsilon [Bacteroidota bacterium]
MFLEIITPDKKLFSGEVKLIKVPGTKGSFAILKNHAPIISTLEKGQIKIVKPNEKEEFIDIDGGMIEVKKNKIIVLADNF